jgi:hypothetical protein
MCCLVLRTRTRHIFRWCPSTALWETLYCPNRYCRYYGIPFSKLLSYRVPASFVDTLLAKLIPEHIQLMLNQLLEDGGVHGESLSTQTVHYVHSVSTVR